MRGVPVALASFALLLSACPDGRGDEDGAEEGITTLGNDGGGVTGTDGGDGSMMSKLDVEPGEEDGEDAGCAEGGFCPECNPPTHTPCDDTSSPANAIGLNCPSEAQFTVTPDGSAAAYGVRSSFGPTNTFDPREGSKYAVIGSGPIANLDVPDNGLLTCSNDLGAFDPGGSLPAPIQIQNVGGQGCANDPGLIGMGDCSNTIQEQFLQGDSANDYTEIRISATVPEGSNSFSYDFAFFSVEYPQYYGSEFNDMYVAWLESEVWTGNISFDEQGNPISLNAGFLDYRDVPAGTVNDPANCPIGTGCTAIELHNTCMQNHAGTKWLSTTAGVSPGEQITVVFAIFDLSDSILDSYAFIDNFQWGCDGDEPPSTVPIG